MIERRVFNFGDPGEPGCYRSPPRQKSRVPGEGSMFPQRSRHIPRSVFPLVQSFSAIHTPTRTFFVAGRQSCRPSSTENSISSRYDHATATWRVKKWSLIPDCPAHRFARCAEHGGALGNVISAWKLLESSSSLTVYLRSREFATAHISIAADSRSFPFVVEYA